MRRGFWLAAGLSAGVTSAVLLNRWMRRQAEKVAPANLAKQAGSVAKDMLSLASQAAEDFRLGARERERELRGDKGSRTPTPRGPRSRSSGRRG